ncbi:MAG: RbsD/FucU family protein [Kiritimatiellales bacterium]
MLYGKLIHPEILDALARAGHGGRLLIADGNYPFSTGAPETATRVYLNFSPGMLNVCDVLTVIKDAIPIESALIMIPPDAEEQEIHREFKNILNKDTAFISKQRFDFYQDVLSASTCLVICTGETRRFANILLTIGVNA